MRVVSVVCCLVFPALLHAQPVAPPDTTGRLTNAAIVERAATLAALRQDIGDVESELRTLRDDERLLVRSLGGQIADLRVTLGDLTRRRDALHRSLNEEAAANRVAGDRTAELSAAVHAGLTDIRASVASGLPFELEARLAAVDELDADLTSGSASPATVLSETVRFLEDELRLTEEFGLYSQAISWKGERQLADVVRIGMVALFVRTNRGEFGHAIPDGNVWRFEPLTDSDSVQHVRTLFGAMGRAVRRGQFDVPLARVAE